jgi:hypothetical protein
MTAAAFLRRLQCAAAIGFVCCASPAAASIDLNDSRLRAHQVDFDYVAPKNASHAELYATLRKMRLLEQLQEFLSPVRLTRRVMIRIQGCDGKASATFDTDTITVCYEYFDTILKHVPEIEREGLTRHDALIGPIVDTFLHEFGHALLRILDIPFFGKEEDVADNVAIYLLLTFAKEDARRLIVGASFFAEAEDVVQKGKNPEYDELADAHSLLAQRHFNRWCLAYGADKELFSDAVDNGVLPENRARWCRYEWATNAWAFEKLIEPYIDPVQKEVVKLKRWFPFESAFPARMVRPDAAPGDKVEPAKRAADEPRVPPGAIPQGAAR